MPTSSSKNASVKKRQASKDFSPDKDNVAGVDSSSKSKELKVVDEPNIDKPLGQPLKEQAKPSASAPQDDTTLRFRTALEAHLKSLLHQHSGKVGVLLSGGCESLLILLSLVKVFRAERKQNWPEKITAFHFYHDSSKKNAAGGAAGSSSSGAGSTGGSPTLTNRDIDITMVNNGATQYGVYTKFNNFDTQMMVVTKVR